MVNVADKSDTKRIAVAHGFITMNQIACGSLQNCESKKGDVLANRGDSSHKTDIFIDSIVSSFAVDACFC